MLRVNRYQHLFAVSVVKYLVLCCAWGEWISTFICSKCSKIFYEYAERILRKCSDIFGVMPFVVSAVESITARC